jgi:hypothetical protein
MRDPSLANTLLTEVARHWGYPRIQLRNKDGVTLLNNLVVQRFAESNFIGEKTGEPLGLLAENLVMFLTSWFDDPERGEVGMNCIYALPVLSIYGQIEETWKQLRAESIDIAKIGKRDWNLFLRCITVPASDQVFVKRTRDIKVLASAFLSKDLRVYFDGLNTFGELHHIKSWLKIVEWVNSVKIPKKN